MGGYKAAGGSNLSPIVLVGMPRSGSTLLVRVLNESPDVFLVNDFYFFQKMKAIGNSETSLPLLANYLLEIIEARSNKTGERALVASLKLTASEITELKEYTNELLRRSPSIVWSELLESVLTWAMLAEGKRVWGWNTPQDYLHVEKIRKHYPNAKFIFLLRHPYAICQSYKNVNASGNDRRRYNPLVQALSWKNLVNCLDQDDKHILVKYEDFLQCTEGESNRLSSALGIFIPPLEDLSVLGSNSSYKVGRARKLTNTEKWIINRFAAKESKRMGYELDRCGPCISDLIEVAGIFISSLIFYLRYLFNRDLRGRALTFLKALITNALRI